MAGNISYPRPDSLQEWIRSWFIRALVGVRADLSFAVVDGLIVAGSYTLAVSLRLLDQRIGDPETYSVALIYVLPAAILVHVLANMLFGAYGHVWEFASISEAKRVILASIAAGVVLVGSTLLARRLFGVLGPIPLTSAFLGLLISVAGMGLVRFRSRLFSFKRYGSPDDVDRVLIVGESSDAAEVLHSLEKMATRIEIVGVVAVGSYETARRIAGAPTVGTLDHLPSLVEEKQVDAVIVAGGASDELARRVVDLCLNIDVRLRVVPVMDSLMNGSSPSRDIRDLELNDLLPRSAVDTHLDDVASILEGKRVLVTGAGGSIGSEIVRQVLGFGPAIVIALDNDETHIFEASSSWDSKEVALELCDIRDRARLGRIFARWQPQVVFHAAAHKHVPLLETCAEEAVKTNVIGTENVVACARANATERFVLISTDKAVDPVSVMGATKRVAEMVIQASALYQDTCRYSAVRFGNVLGSRGSVVPTFVRQIQEGGPVTITDRQMTRYFMTIDEAVQLVLQAAAISEGGEIFVLDMGERVKIIDLARRLIRLAGLVPDRDVRIVEIGARPGERLTENLAIDPLEPSVHPKINLARASFPGPVTMLDSIAQLGHLAAEGDDESIVSLLNGLATQEWQGGETIHLGLSESTVTWNSLD